MDTNEFSSINEWQEFCSYISRKNRYFLNKKWQKFIEVILFTANKRKLFLKKDEILVRARIGHHEKEYQDEKGKFHLDINPLSPNEMGAPPAHKAIEGRANPRGIPYLYLANNQYTAVSETRPWLKQNVSVAYFEILQDLNVIDTSKDKRSTFVYVGDKKPKIPSVDIENIVWGEINDSFSTPVLPSDERCQYIPTQYLSECFKTHGYDGVVYKSSLSEKGYNIVLFNPKTVRLKMTKLFSVESVKYECLECANPYFCK